MLQKEHGSLGTFNEVDIQLIRVLQKTVEIKREYENEEEKEFMQRRVFGLSRLEKSSGVIQDIVDKINLNIGNGCSLFALEDLNNKTTLQLYYVYLDVYS